MAVRQASDYVAALRLRMAVTTADMTHWPDAVQADSGGRQPMSLGLDSSNAGTHTPLIKGGLILLLVHGIIDILVVVPSGWSSWRRLRLVQDARDILHALRHLRSLSQEPPQP